MSKEIGNIGELITYLRMNKNNLSMNEIAKKMYLSKQCFHYWEHEKRKISLETFTTFLNVLGEAVLIKNGKYTIMEDKNMKNKQLKLDFKNFSLLEVVKKHKQRENQNMELASNEFIRLSKTLKENGFNVSTNEYYDPTLWLIEYCNAGILTSIQKDNKTMQIEIEKSSSLELFDLDAFIKDIKNEYGESAGMHIKKAICFSAYKLGIGDSMYYCLKRNKSEDSILSLIPTLGGYEDIVHNQLKTSNKYFIKLNGTVFDKEFPLSYRLGICDDFYEDSIWISLIDENGNKRYQKEPFYSNIILDALNYIKNNFNKFGELFANAVER